MSSVKIKCLLPHKWGNRLITGYGEYDISEAGVVEVPKALSEKLLEMPQYEAVKVAVKSKSKKGDLNKDGKVDKKDLDIAQAQKEGADAMVKEAEAKMGTVLTDLSKKQLKEVAVEMDLNKGEWETLSKKKLQSYIENHS